VCAAALLRMIMIVMDCLCAALEEGGAANNYFDNERCRSCTIEWYDGWFLVVLMVRRTKTKTKRNRTHTFLRTHLNALLSPRFLASKKGGDQCSMLQVTILPRQARDTHKEKVAKAYRVVLCFVLLQGCKTLMGGFFKSHAFLRLLNAGIKCKSTVTVMIYEKSLR
jgi:hypothetical protein